MRILPHGTKVFLASALDVLCAGPNPPEGGRPATVIACIPKGVCPSLLIEKLEERAAIRLVHDRPSFFNRYLVRIERTNSKGSWLPPSYQTPCAGNVWAPPDAAP